MKIGVIGAGRIGGNLATQWARRGHDVLVCFKRDEAELASLAAAIGARWGSVGDAVDHGGGIARDFSEPTAAEHNAHRFATSRLVKSFNSYTAAFQAEVGDGRHADPVAMFLGGEDADAKKTVAALVRAAGFEPVDLGGWSAISLLEAPRRPGAVYGEEYPPEAAQRIAAAAATDVAEAARLADELKEPS
jgi:8-hydroxy-5-deazaflavin:NADPH oxidoreductase